MMCLTLPILYFRQTKSPARADPRCAVDSAHTDCNHRMLTMMLSAAAAAAVVVVVLVGALGK